MNENDYVKPVVVDYGSVQDLTAALGNNFQDVPIGTPIGVVTSSSQPPGP